MSRFTLHVEDNGHIAILVGGEPVSDVESVHFEWDAKRGSVPKITVTLPDTSKMNKRELHTRVTLALGVYERRLRDCPWVHIEGRRDTLPQGMPAVVMPPNAPRERDKEEDK